MTVPKITLLLDTFAKACGDNSKAKELCKEAINFIVKQEREGEVIAVLAEARRVALEQQAQTIEALKLCWNCRHIEADRCNKHNRLVDFPMREKCDQWQVKEGQ